MFSAYDKETGELLWQFNTYTSMLAPPIAFQIDGVQYISILTGNGGGDLFSGEAMDPVAMPASSIYGNYGRLLVFSLGGTETLPEPLVRDTTIPEQTLAEVSNEELARGEEMYHDFCAPCHGLVARSAGAIPDLRQMNEGTHQIFNQIVLEGLLKGNGMAAFDDALAVDDVERIHNYVRARAAQDREFSLGNIDAPKLTWLN
jgi:mono/diheme cytochrome c family protein